MRRIFRTSRAALARLAAAAMVITALPAAAQTVETIDPNAGVAASPGEHPGSAPIYADPTPAAQPEAREADIATATDWADPAQTAATATAPTPTATATATANDPATTYREDDLIGAAEGVFGKGAEGVARMIQRILAEQGEPNAYIVGREAGGAFVFGLRYGSGTLFHKVEGQRPVYWTGPSIGFDAGANAGSTFVLVYNLHDSERLYQRYPAGEGQAYLVGGLTASYLRRGDTVLIPIRVGAGLRLGVNAGYMRFSKRQRWLPF